MESVACPVCEAREARFLFESRDLEFGSGEVFSFVQCALCGLVRVDPRPTAQELSRFYPEENWSRVKGRGDPLNANVMGVPWREHMRRRARDVQAVVPGPARLLEIGCGDGYFLRYMQDLGWEVRGVEPGRAAAEYATKELGVPVECGFPEDLRSSLGRYDAIYMNHVIEHIGSPVETLCRIRPNLAEEGWLYLATPNWVSLDRWLFGRHWMALKPPQHLFLYDRRTLGALLAEAGFALKRTKTASTDGLPPLGYTESFRYWLSHLGLYPARVPLGRSEAMADRADHPFQAQSPWRRGAQIVEQGFWSVLACAADSMGCGTNLKAWAQRS